MRDREILVRGSLLLSMVVLWTTPAAAHGGGISGPRGGVAPPLWLVATTGGGVVAASFLLSSFVTDRSLIDAVHRIGRDFADPPRFAKTVARILGVSLFGFVVFLGVFGPGTGLSNPAVVVVWVGWWAGFTATTYLLGNSWPALDPVAPLSERLSEKWVTRSYPAWLGCWPATVGLLGIGFLETTTRAATDGRILSAVVVAYVAGSVLVSGLFGRRAWRHRIDPVSKAFRYYGTVAPLSRTETGVRIRLPGSALRQMRIRGYDEVGFVVGLLWVTTFDGLVHTRSWTDLIGAATAAGVPALVVSVGVLVGGFSLFYGGFRIAATRIRTDAPTVIESRELATRFAPSLLPIAAGYHFAHFAGYFLSGLPLVQDAIAPPFTAPVASTVVVLPPWMGGLEVGAILVGHLLAVWVAHSTALDLFPGRLQAIRSQYAPVAVMAVYTAVSLWIVSQPPATPQP